MWIQLYIIGSNPWSLIWVPIIGSRPGTNRAYSFGPTSSIHDIRVRLFGGIYNEDCGVGDF